MGSEMWLDAVLIGGGLAATCLAIHHGVTNRSPHPKEFWILGIQSLPFMVLIFAFIVDYDALRLVRSHGSPDLPLHYRVSAAWAGRAGPLLLWVAWLAAVRLWWRRRPDDDSMRNRLGSGVVLHFLILMILFIALLLQPFEFDPDATRHELNVYLQTDLMVIHPPIVFSFYAFCLLVSSIALEGMINGSESHSIHEEQLPAARAAFFTGTVGIGLGGLWAYTVLDWGGYWAWDPVETASFLPWLTALLVIHVRMTPRPDGRESAMEWAPALGLLTGALAMHSTLVTRANGVWASVHAFVVSDSEVALPDDAYLRVLSLWSEGVEGAEVFLEFTIMLVLLGAATLLLARNQAERVHRSGADTLLTNRPFLAYGILLGLSVIHIRSASLSVAVIAIPVLILMIHDRVHTVLWSSVGVIIMLFSRWSWHLETVEAGIGMLLFLLPWLLAPEEDTLPQRPNIRRLSLFVPLAGGGSFLLLTWLLLLAEIDGPSPEAHEAFGAILIGLLAAGILTYSLRRSSERQRWFVLGSGLLLSVVSAWIGESYLPLPGNADQLIATSITRGEIARFLLVWLILAALPALAELVTEVNARFSASVHGQPTMLRLASHVAHAGILLLLIGHVLTTTLVDRVDPSHQVTLIRDEPVQHGDLIFTMRDIETSVRGEPLFDDRFNIGDAFFGIVIDVGDVDGKSLGEVRPGVLRFDAEESGSITPRSEVDRLVMWDGDIIMILDLNQMSLIMNDGLLGGLDEVDRVRLTVYDLPGSHLVWAGWIMIVIGSMMTLKSRNLTANQSIESE
ncbi:MAG TPA: cytochrome c biogenesis protein CcsA [Candidatus Thalassarchaeaceae archaeon]|nr:MAG TPA: hypothetical protein D7H85_01910 [Candidatus Poseidoniales archaeon]HII48618.1 cytochrome c biogenesis protein CcsA [Candidatus Thalassarchaeaceae archaeon]